MSEIKVYAKQVKKLDGDVYRISSKRVSIGDEENDYYSYIESDIEITVKNDGALALWDLQRGEAAIYIYPDQLDHLREALNQAYIAKHDKKLSETRLTEE